MVRATTLTLCLALAGCGSEPAYTARDMAREASVNSGSALAKSGELQLKIDQLETRLAKQEVFTEAVYQSLKEARENHTALRKTFNSNVDAENKRDAAQEAAIGWLQDHTVTK